MDWDTASIVLAALIGAIPALIVSFVQARRSRAEIERIRAEAAKLRAETSHSESEAVSSLVADAASALIDDLREQVAFQSKFNGERIALLEVQKQQEHEFVVALQRECRQHQEMLDKALLRIDVLECEGRKKDNAIKELETENAALRAANESQAQELAELRQMLLDALQQIDELQQCNQRLEAELARQEARK